ncbi:MAG: hypothetical protein ABR526_02725 [Chthoniobacterales bacterium]
MVANAIVHASLFLALFCFAAASVKGEAGMNFAGVSLKPGETVRAEVPLTAQQQSYVAEGGNAVPPHAVAVLATPAGFDPQRSWPVLVVLSTIDFHRVNADDLRDFYRQPAIAEGWVVLAGDGPAPAVHDSAGWRAGTTLAALDALHRSFPGSSKWPIAVTGLSGGAKRAGTIAPLLALAGCRMTGVFLTGINEDRLSEGYRTLKPGAAFLQTPIFLSSGQADEVARVAEQQALKASMERAGFRNVRQEIFPQGHSVSRSAVRAALRWFREAH